MTRIRKQEVAWAILIVATALVGGAVAASGSGLAVGAAAAGIVASIVAVSTRRPQVPLFAAIFLFLVSATDLGRSSEALATATRLGALFFCSVLALRYKTQKPVPRHFVGVGICGGVLYAWAGVTAPSLGWLIDTVGFALALGALSLVATRVSVEHVGAALDAALMVALALSLAMAVTGFSEAIEGNRLEGVFANANTLGFMATVAVMRALLAHRGMRQVTYFGLGATAVVWSASRSPAAAMGLALLVALGISFLQGQKGKRRLLVPVGLVASGGLLFWDQLRQLELAILRSGDSRSAGTEYALRVAEDQPWFGVGYGSSVIEVASSPLRALAEMGWPGFWLVVVAHLWLIAFAWSSTRRLASVLVFGVFHSWFEGWFYSGGSSIFLVFWLLAFSAEGTIGGLRHKKTYAATDPDTRRIGRFRRFPRGAVPEW